MSLELGGWIVHFVIGVGFEQHNPVVLVLGVRLRRRCFLERKDPAELAQQTQAGWSNKPLFSFCVSGKTARKLTKNLQPTFFSLKK